MGKIDFNALSDETIEIMRNRYIAVFNNILSDVSATRNEIEELLKGSKSPKVHVKPRLIGRL